jgi:hypothetical protein
LRNTINLGLQCIISPDYKASEGDNLEISEGRRGDFGKENELMNKTTGKSFSITLMQKAMQAIIDAGGLIAYTRKRLLA